VRTRWKIRPPTRDDEGVDVLGVKERYLFYLLTTLFGVNCFRVNNAKIIGLYVSYT
jgi:hypothetical protein